MNRTVVLSALILCLSFLNSFAQDNQWRALKGVQGIHVKAGIPNQKPPDSGLSTDQIKSYVESILRKNASRFASSPEGTGRSAAMGRVIVA